MSAASGSIVVVGSINADLIVQVQRHPQPGETIPGSGGQMLPGGKGANQAVAAARLGGQVALIGATGDDANAEVALSGLRASGVDLSGVATIPGPTGFAVVTVAQDGENSIVVVPGTNASVGSDLVSRHSEQIGAADVVVCQGEIPREGIEALAPLVRGRFVHNPAPVIDLDPAVLLASDPLVLNEHEAALVLEQLTAAARDRTGAIPKGSAEAGAPVRAVPEAMATALLAAGIPSVIITLGAEGALVVDGDGLTHIPAAPVRAVDTTGAGDAFIGALATALARGDALREAARFASRVGAFAVTGRGAQPSYPTLCDPLPPLGEVARGASA